MAIATYLLKYISINKYGYILHQRIHPNVYYNQHRPTSSKYKTPYHQVDSFSKSVFLCFHHLLDMCTQW